MGNVLVTGGAGFIGHHLCIALSKLGFEVVAIDNMQQLKFSDKNILYKKFVDERIDDLKDNNIALLSLDTRDSSYENLIKDRKPDVIYHMSAIASAVICQKNPDWAFSDNLVSVERVLENIRNTNTVEMVMKDGKLYNANNLNEIYPKEIKADFNWHQAKPVNIPGIEN